MREGRLHATPPSQETGEVRNPVLFFQSVFAKLKTKNETAFNSRA
jgi:hypothetical protein